MRGSVRGAEQRGKIGVRRRGGALHPLDPFYYEHTPPGKLAGLPKLAFGVIMSVLAVRNAMNTTSSRPTHLNGTEQTARDRALARKSELGE